MYRSSVRNVFDQYSQPENRLSHALATSLHEDPKLLRQFARWIAGSQAPKGSLYVLEQSRPGEFPANEEQTGQHGLPDLWIHNGADWSLVVECKVAATPQLAQLRAHQKEAERRGQSVITLLLTARPPKFRVPNDVEVKTWTELYSWLGSASGTPWAKTLMDYMETLERRWAATGYLKEGTLTEFAGIDFDPDEPWNYREAKRLLKLLMDELRTRKVLATTLGTDLKAPGRPAITDDGRHVWDFLKLKLANQAKSHTSYPHFNISFSDSTLGAYLNIPNSMRTSFHRRLLGDDVNDFEEVIRTTTNGIFTALKGIKEARPYLILLQRRYPSQKSIPYVDAALRIDLRTAVRPPGRAQSRAVRHQPEWLIAAYEVLANRRSNLHLAIGAEFDIYRCPAVKTRQLIDLIEGSWLACHPLLQAMQLDKPYV
jgi:hypothetical protein